jgi:hypothetical protein
MEYSNITGITPPSNNFVTKEYVDSLVTGITDIQIIRMLKLRKIKKSIKNEQK